MGIKVLHVFGALDIGGAELRTLELMAELGPEVEPHYLTLSGRAGSLASTVEDSGGHIHPRKLGPSFPLRYRRLLRDVRPDVVHSHLATFSGFLLREAHTAGVPVRIAHFRSDSDGRPDNVRRRAQRAVMRREIDRHATQILGVSEGALAEGYRSDWRRDPRCEVILNGFQWERLRKVPGATVREQLGLGTEKALLIHVGRPSPEKNRVRLVRILVACRRLGLDAHLVLVGPHDQRDDEVVLRDARDSGVAGQVHLFGPVENAATVLHDADVFVLPSIREGLPGAAIEARALDVPVVATQLGGLTLIGKMLDGVETLSLTASDEAWAEAVSRSLQRPRRTAEQALDVFRHSPFSIEVAAAATRRAYGLPA